MKQRIDFEIHNVNLITVWRHHDGEKLHYSNTDAFSGLKYFLEMVSSPVTSCFIFT